MVCIIGDTVDELADLQALIETGLSNSNCFSTSNRFMYIDENTVLDVTYKLSSGDTLLVDQHNHIVGMKEQMKKALDIIAEKSKSEDQTK